MQKKWTALAKRHAVKLRKGPVAARESTLVGWVQKYPVMNECTHFACLMDPRTGTVRWIERGVESQSEDEEEEDEHLDPELAETDPGLVEKGKSFRKPEGMTLSHMHLDRLGEGETQNIEKGDRISRWNEQGRADEK